MLREYLEAMRALWTEETAEYHGELVSFDASWAWPKPVQPHVPVIVGAGGTEKTFAWIAANADGWLTTPIEQDIEDKVQLLTKAWADAGREGSPEIVVLAGKPDADQLARWEELGVTEAVFGMPDREPDEVVAYLERLAGKLRR